MTYAADTKVPVDRTRAELEKVLARYGATAFLYASDQHSAVVGFQMPGGTITGEGRQVRFVLPLPVKGARDFTHTPTGQARTALAAEGEWAKAVRARWRALLLIVKAKLEAVEAGVSVFDDEFLAQIVLPDGTTTGDWMRPQITAAYQSGDMPSILPGTVHALGAGS